MNKIIVSIILTVFLILGINKITDVIYYVEKPDKSAYQVDDVTTLASTSGEDKSEELKNGDIMALFASVSADEGKKILKNVQLATALLKVGVIKLDQVSIMFWEGKLVRYRIISILNLWLLMEKNGPLKK